MQRLTLQVWVVENGVALAGESALAPASALLDAGRISFLSEHLGALCSAVLQDGANVAAYFVWGLLDAFEVRMLLLLLLLLFGAGAPLRIGHIRR
jgi:beta-glucosidase/6-phospho-beta-glucosidase/beta-galactosidase